ncbi:hypothetical protein EYZ11_005368 [Aspergillus tanneri]|uniref:Molybdenum cofactor sulfurase n=1 Tax=Aspergillus tanneri TaxID=1220188 RepID=A0A4S3JIS1_9EURO|nr:uncharacterized protein ATNIH1004_004839 [Aspergillus tanneri]KAA8648949.1 hypothetical protein ATNIH1004_004839 [Aspergillus tanneri]THC95165.1 hypothetical protein EYZ11_005368 [Aspergillus tanneri]
MTNIIEGVRPGGYCKGYPEDVDIIRQREYPLLEDTTYLDHAGTTPYAKSLIDSFSRDLTSNLFGNPHSMSSSSQLSTQRVDDIRLRALCFFNADPDEFDLVFVANTTAGIKLVVDAFRDATPEGFWYGYHVAAHTSLVGARELADMGNRCFMADEEVEAWISELGTDHIKSPRLFAFPAQSNMNGCRFPIDWCRRIRNTNKGVGDTYTLLDAASLVSTSPLDLSDSSAAPDFTVLSFYKIFGFPDLGALIVRKGAGHIFENRRFFGGGTVDLVVTEGTTWHAKKSTIHERLEDGTLPFHNIIALDAALNTHTRLFGPMENISFHTRFLANQVYERLTALTHFNGEKVLHFYLSPDSDYANAATQGPILAFNLRSSEGAWIGKSEVERLACVKKIQIRSGTLCNPGGTADSLGWTGDDMIRHYSLGLRCGDDNDLMDGRPTGILRVSLGAMTNLKDIDNLVRFMEEFYVEQSPTVRSLLPPLNDAILEQPGFYIESLSVYPIKSCGAFKVPDGRRWEVRREGLAWDREWCLIHQGTGTALNQKRYPRMALIQPVVDLDRGILRVTCGKGSDSRSLEIPLNRTDSSLVATSLCQNSAKSSTVCGDQVIVQAYTSPTVSSLFSDFLGVPCSLARFPPQNSTRYSPSSGGNGRYKTTSSATMPGTFPQDIPATPVQGQNRILLSNESPILLISRSSVNRLNETIKSKPKTKNVTTKTSTASPNKTVAADVFRANIVVAESLPQLANAERPYLEDRWESFIVGSDHVRFDVLGSCQRCQMVCIDQYSGIRRDEPFSTLAKTRKFDNKIYFGRHASLSLMEYGLDTPASRTIMVGDIVYPSYGCE